MKKLICIILICWLPILMATANAMSLQMASQAMHDDMQVESTMSCHDKVDTQSVKAHNCINCGFCVMATSVISFVSSSFLNIPEFKSFKTSFINDELQSINHLPADRPPILN